MRFLIPAMLCATLAANAAVEVGKPSPPFSIQRLGASEINLAQYRGKIVVVAFIHTTCPHCQALTRTLNPIAREYEAKGVQFVECAFNAGAPMMLTQFSMAFQPAFPIGWADDTAVRAYLGYLPPDTRMLYVPHLLFLDRRGVVRGDYAGESLFMQNPEASIREELDKLLKPAPAASAHAHKK